MRKHKKSKLIIAVINLIIAILKLANTLLELGLL